MLSPDEYWFNDIKIPTDDFQFQYDEIFYHRSVLSAMALSHHGFILGIGMQTGEVYACDTRFFSTVHDYISHKSEITTISFSRDTKSIASGDKAGFLHVHDLLSKKLKFERKFDYPILKINYLLSIVNAILVLLADQTLHIINFDDNTLTTVHGTFSLFTCSHMRPEAVYTVSQKKVFKYVLSNGTFVNDQETFKPIQLHRDAIDISLSFNGNFLTIIDKIGEIRIFALTAGLTIEFATYFDEIEKTKFAFSAFSFSNDCAIFSTRTSSYSKEFYVIFLNNKRKEQSFSAFNNRIKQIIPHPTQPFIFILCCHKIYKWTYYNPAPLYNSVPQKGLMKRNEPFEEKESEFDASDADDNIVKLPKSPLKYYIPQEGYLSIFYDDLQNLYPEQIYFLPFDKDTIASFDDDYDDDYS